MSEIENAKEIRRLQKEKQLLQGIAAELHWMARRYAHGRQTYVADDLNRVTAMLKRLGVVLGAPDGTVWAKDGSYGWPADALKDPEHQPKSEWM